MDTPLMPKATAVWLVENTALTFEQIAEFTKLHPLEVKGIADGDVAVGIVGMDPIKTKQLTQEELDKAQAEPSHKLKLFRSDLPRPVVRSKGPRYTPVTKRQDKPDAIAWLVRHYPAIKDSQIIRLIGTTKNTIGAIRDRSHWNYSNLNPRDPVLLGLCSQSDLDAVVSKLTPAVVPTEESAGLPEPESGFSMPGSASLSSQPSEPFAADAPQPSAGDAAGSEEGETKANPLDGLFGGSARVTS